MTLHRTIVVAIILAYDIAMKIANIAELKNRLSTYLRLVEKGEEVEIRKRNVPIARVVPLRKRPPKPGRLGAGMGTVRILGNLSEPMIPHEEWESLESDR